jgi:hypothetical protein
MLPIGSFSIFSIARSRASPASLPGHTSHKDRSAHHCRGARGSHGPPRRYRKSPVALVVGCFESRATLKSPPEGAVRSACLVLCQLRDRQDPRHLLARYRVRRLPHPREQPTARSDAWQAYEECIAALRDVPGMTDPASSISFPISMRDPISFGLCDRPARPCGWRAAGRRAARRGEGPGGPRRQGPGTQSPRARQTATRRLPVCRTGGAMCAAAHTRSTMASSGTKGAALRFPCRASPRTPNSRECARRRRSAPGHAAALAPPPTRRDSGPSPRPGGPGAVPAASGHRRTRGTPCAPGKTLPVSCHGHRRRPRRTACPVYGYRSSARRSGTTFARSGFTWR